MQAPRFPAKFGTALLYGLWSAFYACAALRAFARPGACAQHPFLFAGWAALAAGLLLSWAWKACPGPRGLAALLYFPAAMNASFMLIGATYAALVPERMDSALLAIDKALFFGSTPSVALLPLRGAAGDNFFAFFYMLFIAFLFFSLIRFAFLPLRQAQAAYAPVFTAYGAGFIGYALVPAAGPYKTLDAFGPWLAAPEGPFAGLNALMVASGSNGVDVFPSLHIAIGCVLAAVWIRRFPKILPWIAPPVAALCFSTLWLGYHYLIDALAGFALAFCALRLFPQEEACPPLNLNANAPALAGAKEKT